jgi:hypothetical protein
VNKLFSGPSGGSGGSGGCGGQAGAGGGAGGSSIGLLSIHAQIQLTAVHITLKDGGDGGAGGEGQLGGAGGEGGTTTAKNNGACAGGKGGQGGRGGAGGGGLGGHSLGIAFLGDEPTLDRATKDAITLGAKGAGGVGGDMTAAMSHGADGVAAQMRNFP